MTMTLDHIPDSELLLLNRIEDAVVERLQCLQELGARVEAQPANQESGRAVPRGLLTCAYVRSRFERPATALEPVQWEEMQFQLLWRLRDLVNHSESYKLFRACVALLKGFVPCPCCDAGMYPLDAELAEKDEQGYWRFYMLFGLRVQS